MRIIKTFLLIVCILISGLLFITGIAVLIQRNFPACAFFFILSAFIFSVGLLVFRKSDKEKFAELKRNEINKQKYEKQIHENLLIPRTSINAKHISGLDFAEGALCSVSLYNTKIIFERNHQTSYSLPLVKITDISIKTDIDVEKSYVSSAGGAVAGAMLFGPLGAIVGGRTKEKTTKTISSYLIFTYDKNGTTDFIYFDVTGVSKAFDFVTFFLKNKSVQKIEIEL